MKHNFKITAILVVMFLITQLIGLVVISGYQHEDNKLPFGMEPPEEVQQLDGVGFLVQIMIAFVFAIFLLFILTKLNAEKFLRLWFFVVTTLAIALTFNIVLVFSGLNVSPGYLSIIALVFALPLATFKIFKRDMLIHNLTELMIYPGIAAVFVPILGILGIIILLLVISLYDIWAVWKSKFMQNMAKYQINKLKFFTGFFVPYAGKKQRLKIKKIKEKYAKKGDKELEKQFKKAKIKVNLAILGGGDVIFPIITAGIFLKVMGLIPALIITLSATLGLLGLFTLARKGKFYPAMPFLTIAMYLGMVVNWLIF